MALGELKYYIFELKGRSIMPNGEIVDVDCFTSGVTEAHNERQLEMICRHNSRKYMVDITFTCEEISESQYKELLRMR